MRHPVDIIVPDTGPLITLAAADRLDLLQSFERPVRVLDVVKAECLRHPGKLAYDELKAWFESTGGNQHQVVETPMINAYHAAVEQGARTGSSSPTKGMGDATIVWFERNLPSLYQPGTTTLIMTEDATLGDVNLGRRAHVLSTRAFLKALENIEVIDSAADIIRAVQDRGRAPSRYHQDRRGKDAAGDTTDWIEQAVALRNLDRFSR